MFQCALQVTESLKHDNIQKLCLCTKKDTHSEFKLPTYLNLKPKGDKIYIIIALWMLEEYKNVAPNQSSVTICINCVY